MSAPAARSYSWYFVNVLKPFSPIYYSRNQSEIVYDQDMRYQENETDAIFTSGDLDHSSMTLGCQSDSNGR